MKSKVKKQTKQLEGSTCNDVYIVDKILKKRKFPGGIIKYLVKWVGFSYKETTWEPREHFEKCFYLIVEYEKRLKGKKKRRKLTCQRRIVKQSNQRKFTLKSFNSASSPGIVNNLISEDSWKHEEEPLYTGSVETNEGSTTFQEECEPPPETILGVTHSPCGELLFIVKWSPDEGSIVQAKDAKVKWPKVVINFYEQKYKKQYCSVNYSDGFEDIEDTADHKTRLLFLQQKSKELKDS